MLTLLHCFQQFIFHLLCARETDLCEGLLALSVVDAVGWNALGHLSLYGEEAIRTVLLIYEGKENTVIFSLLQSYALYIIYV